MKKIAIFLLLSITVLLSACGGSSDNTSESIEIKALQRAQISQELAGIWISALSPNGCRDYFQFTDRQLFQYHSNEERLSGRINIIDPLNLSYYEFENLNPNVFAIELYIQKDNLEIDCEGESANDLTAPNEPVGFFAGLTESGRLLIFSDESAAEIIETFVPHETLPPLNDVSNNYFTDIPDTIYTGQTYEFSLYRTGNTSGQAIQGIALPAEIPGLETISTTDDVVTFQWTVPQIDFFGVTSGEQYRLQILDDSTGFAVFEKSISVLDIQFNLDIEAEYKANFGDTLSSTMTISDQRGIKYTPIILSGPRGMVIDESGVLSWHAEPQYTFSKEQDIYVRVGALELDESIFYEQKITLLKENFTFPFQGSPSATCLVENGHYCSGRALGNFISPDMESLVIHNQLELAIIHDVTDPNSKITSLPNPPVWVELKAVDLDFDGIDELLLVKNVNQGFSQDAFVYKVDIGSQEFLEFNLEKDRGGLIYFDDFDGNGDVNLIHVGLNRADRSLNTLTLYDANFEILEALEVTGAAAQELSLAAAPPVLAANIVGGPAKEIVLSHGDIIDVPSAAKIARVDFTHDSIDFSTSGSFAIQLSDRSFPSRIRLSRNSSVNGFLMVSILDLEASAAPQEYELPNFACQSNAKIQYTEGNELYLSCDVSTLTLSKFIVTSQSVSLEWQVGSSEIRSRMLGSGSVPFVVSADSSGNISLFSAGNSLNINKASGVVSSTIYEGFSASIILAPYGDVSVLGISKDGLRVFTSILNGISSSVGKKIEYNLETGKYLGESALTVYQALSEIPAKLVPVGHFLQIHQVFPSYKYTFPIDEYRSNAGTQFIVEPSEEEFSLLEPLDSVWSSLWETNIDGDQYAEIVQVTTQDISLYDTASGLVSWNHPLSASDDLIRKTRVAVGDDGVYYLQTFDSEGAVEVYRLSKTAAPTKISSFMSVCNTLGNSGDFRQLMEIEAPSFVCQIDGRTREIFDVQGSRAVMRTFDAPSTTSEAMQMLPGAITEINGALTSSLNILTNENRRLEVRNSRTGYLVYGASISTSWLDAEQLFLSQDHERLLIQGRERVIMYD